MSKGSSGLSVGDRVRYTPSGLKATRPPVDDAEGVVIEVEDYAVLVRWPFGSALEFPNHIALS